MNKAAAHESDPSKHDSDMPSKRAKLSPSECPDANDKKDTKDSDKSQIKPAMPKSVQPKTENNPPQSKAVYFKQSFTPQSQSQSQSSAFSTSIKNMSINSNDKVSTPSISKPPAPSIWDNVTFKKSSGFGSGFGLDSAKFNRKQNGTPTEKDSIIDDDKTQDQDAVLINPNNNTKIDTGASTNTDTNVPKIENTLDKKSAPLVKLVGLDAKLAPAGPAGAKTGGLGLGLGGVSSTTAFTQFKSRNSNEDISFKAKSETEAETEAEAEAEAEPGAKTEPGAGSVAGIDADASLDSNSKSKVKTETSEESIAKSANGSNLSFNALLKSSAPQSDSVETSSGETGDLGSHSVFKPAMPLIDAKDLQTFEEDETTLFAQKCKLFQLVSQDGATLPNWVERGVGLLKLNTNASASQKEETETMPPRLVMRTDLTFRLVLNNPLFAGVKPVVDNNYLRITLIDPFSKKPENFAIKLKTRHDATLLADQINGLF